MTAPRLPSWSNTVPLIPSLSAGTLEEQTRIRHEDISQTPTHRLRAEAHLLRHEFARRAWTHHRDTFLWRGREMLSARAWIAERLCAIRRELERRAEVPSVRAGRCA